MSARLRRLQAEYERLNVLFRDHDRIRIAEAVGDPPEKYVIEYRVRGLVETKAGVEERGLHRVQITLGPDYPRVQPECVALDPVFHPNIDYLAICTADVSAAGQKLEDTIIFIGEMILYQTYNLQSPRNGDARVWTEQNLDRLPLEDIELRPRSLLEGAELPVLAVPTAGAPRLDLEQVNAPAVEITQPKCANCGRHDEAAGLQACSSGHIACSDCVLSCANCERTLCALCEVGSCVECRRSVCSDCLVACSCSRRVCPEHALQCPVCGSIRCRACPAPCQGCGSLYCREHLDDAKLCPACQPKHPPGERAVGPESVAWVDRFSLPAHGELLSPVAESPVAVIVTEPAPVGEVAPSGEPGIPAFQEDGAGRDWASMGDARVQPSQAPAAAAVLVNSQDDARLEPSLPSSAEIFDPVPAPAGRVVAHLVITEDEAMSVPAAALVAPELRRQIAPLETESRSGKAIVSLIFGILGIPLLGLLVGWFAVLFGMMALRDMKRSKHLLGRRLAISGVALGIFDIVLWLVLFGAYGPSLFVPRFGPAQGARTGVAIVLRARA